MGEEITELEQKLKEAQNSVDSLLLEQLTEQNKEYKQIISKLEVKINQPYKTMSELKNEVKNPIKEQEKTFFCDNCQLTKTDILTKRKADCPFEPRLHGRMIYLCSSCLPYVKELSEVNFEKEDNPYKVN
ncbi:hypothetical protein C1645_743188 [Glomus cerebriforme]|uniref:Uncharacterized protein n=1 Tax=Glomus cerebriforme TaxID=658196 RepID=A0A397SKZ5_9GLOM|nr:hypothetical protein C1645_743188 [Glomus cerebriforme]